MRMRFLVLVLVIPALIAVLAACGDDDDDGGSTGEPDATQAVDDDGDDTGGDDDSGSGGNRGAGTVTRGDETYLIAMDSCIIDQNSFRIGGTTSTADGQPAYFAAQGSEQYDFVGIDLGIGSTSYFDVERGGEHYETAGYTPDAEFIPPYISDPDLVVEVNGGVHVSFTAPVDPFDDSDDIWSIDVSCE